MNIGDKILYKGEKAFIADKWNPHLLNPKIFKSDEVGYAIVTKDGKTHICTKEDEIFMERR